MRTSGTQGVVRVSRSDAKADAAVAREQSRSRDRRLNAIVISGVIALFIGLGLVRAMDDQEHVGPDYPAKPRWARGGADAPTPSTRVYRPECDATKLSGDEVRVIITSM
jgi:hypothetical protein